MASTYDELLNNPELFQAVYNQAMGIPAAGRSLYQRWLASQGQRSATDYILSQTPNVGTPSGDTYQEYLARTKGAGRPDMSGYFGNIMNMTPQEQRALWDPVTEGGLGLPGYTRRNILQAGFRESGAPGFIARGLTGAALAEEPQFQIREPVEGEVYPTGGLGGASFLNYLRSKYGL